MNYPYNIFRELAEAFVFFTKFSFICVFLTTVALEPSTLNDNNLLIIMLLVGVVLFSPELLLRSIRFHESWSANRHKAFNLEEVLKIAQNQDLHQCLSAIDEGEELKFLEVSSTEASFLQDFQSTLYIVLDLVLLQIKAVEKATYLLHSRPLISYFNLSKYEKAIADFNAIYEVSDDFHSYLLLTLAYRQVFSKALMTGVRRDVDRSWIKSWTCKTNAKLLEKEVTLQNLINCHSNQ
jgi:hypothetical protein